MVMAILGCVMIWKVYLLYTMADTMTKTLNKTLCLMPMSGSKMKTVTRKDGEVVTYRDMHSPSVGDIVEDVDNGSFSIVASFGSKDITEQVKAYFEQSVEVA